MGAGPERGGGLLLIGEDLAVGQAGAVIDRGVDVAVPGPRAGLTSGRAAEGLVPAAVGDVAEFLDVDVDQVTRRLVFGAANHVSGGAVGPGQPVEPVADQNPVHGGRVQTQQAGDTRRSPPP